MVWGAVILRDLQAASLGYVVEEILDDEELSHVLFSADHGGEDVNIYIRESVTGI